MTQPHNDKPNHKLAGPYCPETCEPPPSQITEDWLFAYTNARSCSAREEMWPHLVEAIESLIAESQQKAHHTKNKP